MPVRDRRQLQEGRDLIKTSLNLPASLWKRVRIQALEEGRDAQSIVAELLEEFLQRPVKKKEKP